MRTQTASIRIATLGFSVSMLAMISGACIPTLIGQPANGGQSTGSSGGATNPSPTAPMLSLLAGNIYGAGDADGVGVNASFNGPSGMAMDSAGTIYVADYNNNTIRKITAAGAVTAGPF